jgi:hypothetical protein
MIDLSELDFVLPLRQHLNEAVILTNKTNGEVRQNEREMENNKRSKGIQPG